MHNFQEILALVASHDPIVQKRLQGPWNAVDTSAEVQNTLLHIMGEMVKKICKEVKDDGVYSVLADESCNVVLLCRYVIVM